MKVRLGFVSNSSSSSFVCSVDGEVYTGYDASLYDFGLFECVNGHVFHESYLPENLLENLEDPEHSDYDEDFCGDRYDFPEKHCPICSFQKIAVEDIQPFLQYLLKLNDSDIENEIRKQFKTYDEFSKAIKKYR